MKLKSVILFFCLALFLFQGCVPSLHPLYTKDKLTMHPSIPGVWEFQEKGDDDLSSWEFTAHKDQSYSLVQYDTEGKPGTFDVHLIKLGDDHFFNFTARLPGKSEIEAHPKLIANHFNEFEVFHYYPVNTFAKVTFESDQMSISFFDGAYLEDLLKENRIRIKHEKVDANYVLTAKPEELQKFILKYSNDPEAFPEADIMKKI